MLSDAGEIGQACRCVMSEDPSLYCRGSAVTLISLRFASATRG